VVTLASSSTISGSSTDILSLINNADLVTPANYNASITGTTTATDIAAIDSDTLGTVTAENITDTFAGIVSLSTNNASVLNTASGTVQANGSGITDIQSFATIGRALVISSLAGSDQVEGTAFNDTIIGGTGADLLVGGGGNDIFRFAAGDSTTSAYDIITDFQAANDNLDLAGTPSVAGNTSNAQGSSITNGVISLAGTDATNVDTLTEWVTVARQLVDGIGEVGIFEFGGSTFVYQETVAGNSNSDLLIELQSVTGITSLNTSSPGADSLFIS